ncbi:hypothetical protein Aglo01_40620 [Actinokineospora globicatena]|nr:hypothetical protein Aglo01_40620 [Actinokineospora globicatena]GLW86009.1 hypothetical protein Aglo02_36490 [Actinokineospora globicatena]
MGIISTTTAAIIPMNTTNGAPTATPATTQTPPATSDNINDSNLGAWVRAGSPNNDANSGESVPNRSAISSSARRSWLLNPRGFIHSPLVGARGRAPR